MLNKICSNKNSKYIVITPLRPDDKISPPTRISVKRNKLPFNWYSYQSDGNVVENFQKGLFESLKLKENRDIKYCIKIDNDIVWDRNTLDKMYNCLEKSNKNIAYAYCGFEFFGAVKQKFPLIPFDIERLKKGNHISSNSMFKIDVIKEIPMITDNKYKRLLDYCYFLKLLKFNYIGRPCDGYFYAFTKPDSISAGSTEEYNDVYKRVKKDFIDVL